MLIADLHIHSKYSRATSRDCVPEYLDFWARRKGIHLVGTGDFTHPAWRAELSEKLVPAEEGLYTLGPGHRFQEDTAPGPEPRFVVSGEISTIYKKDGRTRKVHSVILLPSLEAADLLSRKLETIGNIRSDGRPILGLDTRDLLEITLESCPEAIFIPAHIWTPHFSVFGAFSGFDSLEACFGDLSGHIHALETGLSSDPPMNWRLSALDGYQLVSHSDAHSPSKLGREADLLDIAPSYPALRRALETGEGLAGTVEFYPEEGKYHLDGHRNCRCCLTPEETAEAGGHCPVCGKPVTIGVLHRVEALADRPEGARRPGAKPFEHLVPLPEVIAASEGGTAASGRVNAKYEALLRKLGPEFQILRETPLEDIAHAAGPLVAEGIRRMRTGAVRWEPGYDGAYGVLGLLAPEEREALRGQVSLFGAEPEPARKKRKTGPSSSTAPATLSEEKGGETLNPAQTAAVTSAARAVCVTAGPGTGKTRTLAARAAWLIRERGVKPGEITAVTFTNRAAGELRTRLEALLGGKRAAHGITVGTFHSICLDILSKRPQGARLAGPYETLAAAEAVLSAHKGGGTPGKLLEGVSRWKNGRETDVPEELCRDYCAQLEALGLLDYDDLLLETLALWREGRPAAGLERSFRHLLVDEFQDCDAVQYDLLMAWGRKGESLFAIGDPDQSIYGFRGAEPACFARLEEDFPDLERVTLFRNYRSTPEILGAALSVIDRNPGPARVLEPQCPSGAPVRVLEAESDLSEAIFVAKEVARQMGGVDMLEAQREGRGPERPRGFQDFAVLCRTRRQLDLLEQCLGRDGIPCVVAGRDDFLTDRRVRGGLCFLRNLLEPGDSLALRSALSLSWNCPADLSQAAEEAWAGSDGTTEERVYRLMGLYPQVPCLEQWGELALELLPTLRRERPDRLLGRWAAALGCTEEEPVQRLLHMAVFYPTLPELLKNLTIGREGDLLRSAGLDYEAGAVSLMTLHASKGLEFPVVFLCGVKAGTLPLERQDVDDEEERRLFYVGMTRAREELILLTRKEASPFLEELHREGVERGRAASRCPRQEAVQMSLF